MLESPPFPKAPPESVTMLVREIKLVFSPLQSGSRESAALPPINPAETTRMEQRVAATTVPIKMTHPRRPIQHLTAVEAEIGELRSSTLKPQTGDLPYMSSRLSTHWQWVIMLVILVVGIAAIWIGACVWRRRYLRKKDRQTTLSQKTPVTGAGVPGSDSTTPMTFARDPEQHAENRDKEKKKWNVEQRT
jgi:hypothetical protein